MFLEDSRNIFRMLFLLRWLYLFLNFKASTSCNHGKAKKSVFMLVQDLEKRNGIQPKISKTIDTDVTVLTLVLFSEMNLTELWIKFGIVRSQVHLLAPIIWEVLRTENIEDIFFHTFVRYDQTSFSLKLQEKSVSSTWQKYVYINEAFKKLGSTPTKENMKDAMPALEHSVVLMYDRASNCLNP